MIHTGRKIARFIHINHILVTIDIDTLSSISPALPVPRPWIKDLQVVKTILHVAICVPYVLSLSSELVIATLIVIFHSAEISISVASIQ